MRLGIGITVPHFIGNSLAQIFAAVANPRITATGNIRVTASGNARIAA